ncbi:hypothetical protein ADIS_0873 [Lunatimonas lonarensis]|uniref:Uncharacterized protein n=1 Tax=Lunatimonas lonarensis TaxID=1232681 RepID=R7ZXJ1_9BACT|nr:hypothetical protein ADIS_0873 [Lunatimonas lonarensis]
MLPIPFLVLPILFFPWFLAVKLPDNFLPLNIGQTIEIYN